MLKPTGSYRMSTQTKRMLAGSFFESKEHRNAWKRAMIDAELTANAKPVNKKLADTPSDDAA